VLKGACDAFLGIARDFWAEGEDSQEAERAEDEKEIAGGVSEDPVDVLRAMVCGSPKGHALPV
jgi:hypothetical protein